MELKKILILFVVWSLLFPFTAWATDKGKRKETAEEKAHVDQFLASQVKGRPIEGKSLKKRLEVDPHKVLKQKLAHPKSAIQHPLETQPAKLKDLNAGNRKHEERESRFKPDRIQNRLETGPPLKKKLK